uniref:Uncharacterized protein n=1 Tax=Corethron hystrix TaxID=216773 RepID=A0A7S1BA65_9STRA
MATDDEYLYPLSQFRKRIAYANAFGTDFVVPVGTGVFLHKNSDFIHTLKKNELNQSFSMLVGVFTTENLYTDGYHTSSKTKNIIDDENSQDELLNMSIRLDSLGWTKKSF